MLHLGRTCHRPSTLAPRPPLTARTQKLRTQTARPVVAAKAADEEATLLTGQHWKEQGVDVLNKTLEPGIKQQLLQYGELVQAAYDNLGLDRCNPGQYGNALQSPGQLLAYLQGCYSVTQGEPAPAQSTFDRYKLSVAVTDPATGTTLLSPLIEALPGKGDGGLPSPNNRLDLQTVLVDNMFATVPGLLVTFIDGANGGWSLFPTNKDGRGKKPRGTFFGFVAVSEPHEGSSGTSSSNGTASEAAAAEEVDGGRDVALVWRGTVFREEWESNFAQDELALWDPDRRSAGAGSSTQSLLMQSRVLPKADEVGVHAGFDDLYTRSFTKEVEGREVPVPSPREVVHAWLPRLLREHNVSTITTTGHSLGGALATLSAFDIAQHLKKHWDSWDRSGWQTQEPPQVRVVTFAAPRLGNATFVEEFQRLGIAALRIENKGDVVPDVPGIWVQALTAAINKVSPQAAVDTTSTPAALLRQLYRGISTLFQPLNPDRWGYFHVGQSLQLDPEWAGPGFLDVDATAKRHNLELYIYLLSLLGPNGPQQHTTRNPLLLNKSDGLLGDKRYPADWWRAPDRRGCRQDADKHWVYQDGLPADALGVVQQHVGATHQLVEAGIELPVRR